MRGFFSVDFFFSSKCIWCIGAKAGPHKIIGCLGLEGTLKIVSIQHPSHSQEGMPPIRPGLISINTIFYFFCLLFWEEVSQYVGTFSNFSPVLDFSSTLKPWAFTALGEVSHVLMQESLKVGCCSWVRCAFSNILTKECKKLHLSSTRAHE